MTARWYDLQDKLWFIPTLCTVSAAILAIVMVQVDHAWVPQRRSDADWIFGAGVSGAREVLSVIAGTMITVTGLVFSITIVALQLASSQFTPRILRSFTGDRGNQLVLGVFIATFTYALLVLRTVQDAAADGTDAFVPAASVTVALVLAAASVGFLIYFISHAADSIRVSVIIDRATRDTLGVIAREYGEHGDVAAKPGGDGLSSPGAAGVEIRSSRSGYLQRVNERHLLDAVENDDLILHLTSQVGEFVFVGTIIGVIDPQPQHFDQVVDQINEALILGPERTLQADVDFGLRQIADIAVKALSPGINDPATATNCIDRLGQLLLEIAHRPDARQPVKGKDGRGTVVRRSAPWEQLVHTAFNEIRHYGQTDPMAAEHLARTLNRMQAIVPVNKVGALQHQRQTLIEASQHTMDNAVDRERIVDAR